ncbi:hypothetical protein Tco_0995853 [Tanacetum coccineum]
MVASVISSLWVVFLCLLFLVMVALSRSVLFVCFFCDSLKFYPYLACMIPTIIPADVSAIVHVFRVVAEGWVGSVFGGLRWQLLSVAFQLPGGNLTLDYHTTLETDSFEDPSFPAHALVAPITSPFLFTSSDSSESSRDFSDSYSSDSIPLPNPYETAVARWGSKVALRSSSLPSTSTLPPTPSDGVLKMLTARKRVHPFLARILVNRRRFNSSSSSPPRKRRRTSPCSSSSATHSSSPMSAGPSRKRCRLRDPSSTYCHEVNVEVSTEMDIEDSIEAGAEGDIERETEDSYESDTESDINSNILADIEADIAAKAAAAIAADTAADAVVAVEGVRDKEMEDAAKSSARGTIKIGIDVVMEPEDPDDILVPTIAESQSKETFEIRLDIVIQQLYDHMLEFPSQRIEDIKEE